MRPIFRICGLHPVIGANGSGVRCKIFIRSGAMINGVPYLGGKGVTPSHLLVTYRGRSNIRFQAVRLDGIVITLQKFAPGVR